MTEMSGESDARAAHPAIRRLSAELESVPLALIEGQNYDREKVYLDGRHWRRCIFSDCDLWVIFGRWRFEDCQFIRSKFMFVDSAGQVCQMAQDLVTQGPRN
jgi:hypothetical protein